MFLVHGTKFLPGQPKWISEGALHEAISRENPECRIHPFAWDGWNLHSSRVRAAIRLRDEIEAVEGDVVVVGHSHGGNVGRMAMSLARERDGRVGLVTLATPFLRARTMRGAMKRREAPVDLRKLLFLVVLFAAALSFIHGAAGSETSLHGSAHFLDSPDEFEIGGRCWVPGATPERGACWGSPNGFTESVLGFVSAALAIELVVVAAGMLVGVGAIAGLSHTLFAWRLRGLSDNAAHATYALLGSRTEPATRVIAVRSDEAAAVLAIAQFFGGVGTAMLRVGGRLFERNDRQGLLASGITLLLLGLTAAYVTLVATVAVDEGWCRAEFARGTIAADCSDSQEASVAFVHRIGAIAFGAAADEVAAATAVVAVVLGLLGLIGTVVFAAEYLTTGFDGAALARYGRVSSTPLPPGTSEATYFETEEDHRSPITGLRHSWVYRHPAAVARTVREVGALSGRPTPSVDSATRSEEVEESLDRQLFRQGVSTEVVTSVRDIRPIIDGE